MGKLSTLIAEYENPQGKDPHEYVGYQRGFNEALTSRVREYLERNGLRRAIREVVARYTSSDEFALLVTGSDGRAEKGIASPIELVLVADGQQHTPGLAAEAEQVIRSCIEMHSENTSNESTLFGVKHIEVKNTGEGNLSMYTRKPGVIMPSRLFDAKILIGNEDVAYLAKRELVHEFRGDTGHSTMKKLRTRLQVSRNICRSGSGIFQGTKNIYFDPSTGTIHYKPEANIHGLKPGPLRLVQGRLNICLVRTARKTDRSDAERVVMDSPTNTLDRIAFLHAEKVLGSTFKAMTELGSLYEYFLWLYATSEYEYQKNGKESVTANIPELRAAINDLLKLDSELAKFEQ